MTDRPLSSIERSLHKLIAAKPIAAINSRLLPHLDRAVYRLSGGRTTFLGLSTGLPVITLTTIGAKSGQPRVSPLICIRDPERPGTLAVIGSNWGQAHAPSWYYNLRSHPQATGSINGVSATYQAHEATDAEYDRLWQLAVDTYAGYAVYKVRASHRRIPVMVLTPVSV